VFGLKARRRPADDRMVRRLTFGVRLALAAIGMLASVLLVGQLVVADTVRDSFIAKQVEDYSADARALEQAVQEAGEGEDPIDEAREVIEAVAARPAVAGVELLDVRGRVVAGTDPASVGDVEDGPAVAVARTGTPYAGAEQEAHEEAENFEYAVPVVLPAGRFALGVDQDREPLDRRLAELRENLLVLLLASIPVGGALFFLLGGRGLARQHRATVERSLRDGHTGLGNHPAFQARLAAEVAVATRYGGPLALAIVDIDDFKFANDSLGHCHGDRVLAGVGAALSGGRGSDGCYRIGGDEFAVVMPRTDLTGAHSALDAAVARAVDELPGLQVSVGLATLASADGSLELLWEQADAAMYEAKRVAGSAIVAFEDISTDTAITHPERLRALRRLIADDEVGIAFQPIWDLDRNEILGYEALSRPAEDYGFSGPGEAFALAEKTGHAHLLCDLARRSALAQADRLPPGALLFLNVSPQTLEHDMLAGDGLVRAVEAAGLEPERVVLELTEHATSRLDQVVREAARLRGLGFKLALDDVGAGNAGLDLLRSIGADFVKIDRAVVAGAATDRSARGVLEAVIVYARRTGAFVIAEGIETTELLDLVRNPFSVLPDDRAPGVGGAQGFLLGRPESSFEATTATSAVG